MRTWLIRLVILGVLGSGAGGLWYLNEWVSPERVRQALLEALREKLPGVEVEIDYAGLRLFSGLTVENLSLRLPDEPEPFFIAPRAIIAHDKQSLNRGRLEIRKIEIETPTLRLTRKADGHFNLADIFRQRTAEELPTLPTLSIKQALVIIHNETDDGVTSFGLQKLNLQMVNDPLAILKVEANFSASPWVNQGPVAQLNVPLSLSAKYNRLDGSVVARVEIPELQLTPDLAPALARFHPDAGDYLAQGQALLAIKAELRRESNGKLKHEVKIDVKDGRFEDERLPWPLEQINGQIQLKDGHYKVMQSTARLGKANVELTLESRHDPDGLLADLSETTKLPLPSAQQSNSLVEPLREPLGEFADELEKLQLTIRELAIDDELFAKLPPEAHRARQNFNPQGTIDLSLNLTRTPHGIKQEFELRPNKASMVYEKFRYPVEELSGFVRRVSLPNTPAEYRVQITGNAGGRRIELTGRVGTEGPDPLIELKLTGVDIPINEQLMAAMPEKYAESLGKLRVSGRGDVHVDIRQSQGVNRCETTVRVNVHDGQVHYALFPYPLRKIRGQVTVRITAIAPDRPLKPGLPLMEIIDTDRVELRKFSAMHGDGKLWLEGDSEPVFGSQDRKLKLRIQGESLPFDGDLKAAIQALPTVDLWRLFSPRGLLTFGADVEIIERAAPKTTTTEILARPASSLVIPAEAYLLPGEPPFNPLTDLKITVKFKGPTIKPEFLAYELQNLAGIIRYNGGQIDLAWLEATHGQSSLRLDAANIILADSGEVWANLGGLQMRPFVVDAAMLAALPNKLRNGLKELKPTGPMDLNVKHMVISFPATSPSLPPPPTSLNATNLRTVARAQAETKPTPDPIVYWNTELKLHGASFEAGTTWQNVHGTIASVGRYNQDHLESALGNIWFDRATVNKQPITNAKFSYRTLPQVADAARPGAFTPIIIQVPDLSANAYHGTLGGEAWISLGDETRFRLWMNIAGLRLEELAAAQGLGQGGELRGLVQAKVLLESNPDPATGVNLLTGSGQVDIPNGRLYNVPVLMPLLKLMKLQTPDETAFEEAHALFTLTGKRLVVTQLDLIGTAVSLGGAGEMNIHGDDVHFEFYTIWSQALKRWLTTPFGDVQSYLSGNLFRIDMIKQRGGVMEYRPQMLPVVTDPVKLVAERLRNRFGPTR